MRKVCRMIREVGPVSLAIVGGLVIMPAFAQQTTESRVLACDRFETATDRLACFESILRDVRASSASGDDRESNAAEDTVPDDSSVAEQSVEPTDVAAQSGDASDSMADATVAESTDQEAGTSIPAVDTTSMTSPDPTGSDPSDSTGSSDMEITVVLDEEETHEYAQMEEELRAGGEIRAVIVDVRESQADRRFFVELDNGQVWRETQGSRIGMPKVGREVRIYSGRFGSFRMRVDGLSRTARVRRVR